ncbi:aspartate/glutamate racemase family protein [Profundibacter amoris]|uniref:Asp/Glu racemase n=1 Tax=Profundibacter amoris TaxID=2171755 RepID=A0A347UHQ0_9RHOB|nr:hypothetical protein [Profundibacter amoris]AXX98378.1 hypothetical protein BAR1_10840 [Profundibacter amoris]
MRIAFLHTAEVHVKTFDGIFQNLNSKVELIHKVDSSLLERAQRNGLEDVRSETIAALTELSAAEAVVCTCSTLGPIADELSKTYRHIFRIDRPVMEEACRSGENILVAICLESTRDATLALLNECALQMGKVIRPEIILCKSAWPYFERGEMAMFATEIAETIKAALLQRKHTDCVVLAQASMRVAEGLLENAGPPVVSSPLLAAKRAIEIAGKS